MEKSNNADEGKSIAQAFIEHKSVLSAYLAHKFLSQADIDDLLQDIFEQAYLAEKKRDITSPKGYLFGVARNLLSQRYAKNARRISVEINDAQISDLAAEFISPENKLYYKIKMKILVKAIKTLPPQCQKVFILRKIRGLSQKKIASRLKISTSTVERHITIALSRLNATLAEQGYSETENSHQERSNVRRLK